MAESDLKDEYLDISSNLRHWNTLRFAELTIFFAIMGGLLNVLISRADILPSMVALTLKGVGLLATIFFGILQERTMQWWYNFLKRILELEEILGYRQYSCRPISGFLSGRNSIRFFFTAIALFWVISFFWKF